MELTTRSSNSISTSSINSDSSYTDSHKGMDFTERSSTSSSIASTENSDTDKAFTESIQMPDVPKDRIVMYIAGSRYQ